MQPGRDAYSTAPGVPPKSLTSNGHVKRVLDLEFLQGRSHGQFGLPTLVVYKPFMAPTLSLFGYERGLTWSQKDELDRRPKLFFIAQMIYWRYSGTHTNVYSN